jgi:hypothetical protein
VIHALHILRRIKAVAEILLRFWPFHLRF